VDPVVSFPGDGERFERGNRTLTIRIDLPGLSVVEIEFDDTFSVDPHTHDDHVDSFYVLDGEVEFTVGDKTVRAGPGTRRRRAHDTASVAPAARHACSTSTRPMRASPTRSAASYPASRRRVRPAA
jgi:quercetin dioxygenase-like cupin family protein